MPHSLYEPKPDSQLAKSSPVGEAAAILTLLRTADSDFDDHVVVCATDSDVVFKRWQRTGKPNKNSTSPALDARLRDIALHCTTHNIALILAFINSPQNRADVLTREPDLQSFLQRNGGSTASGPLSERDPTWFSTQN
jgi:hypothetical protein